MPQCNPEQIETLAHPSAGIVMFCLWSLFFPRFSVGEQMYFRVEENINSTIYVNIWGQSWKFGTVWNFADDSTGSSEVTI